MSLIVRGLLVQLRSEAPVVSKKHVKSKSFTVVLLFQLVWPTAPYRETAVNKIITHLRVGRGVDGTRLKHPLARSHLIRSRHRK